MTGQPADQVRADVEDFLEYELSNGIGGSGLRQYEWDGEEVDEDPYPPLIVKDDEGRRFEVEFNVHVVELTEQGLAERAAFVKRMQQHKYAGGAA